MKTENYRSGFTLVEIMIVVAILVLLAAIAIPNFVRARRTSELMKASAGAREFKVQVLGGDLATLANRFGSEGVVETPINLGDMYVTNCIVTDTEDDHHETYVKTVNQSGVDLMTDPVQGGKFRHATFRELLCLGIAESNRPDVSIVALGSYRTLNLTYREIRLYPAIHGKTLVFVRLQEKWPTNTLFAVVRR